MFVLDDVLIASAIASVLASLGGTAASMSSQAAVRKKQNAARVAESARQADIDRRRNIALDTAVPEYSREKQEARQTNMADQIAQYLAPTVNPATEYLPGNPGAPKEITDSLSRRLVGALQTGKDYAKDLSRVSSYGRLNFGNQMGLNRLGEKMNMLNTESARSTNLLPIEMEGAYGAGVGGQNMASILNGVAGLADAATAYSLMTPRGVAGVANAADAARPVLKQPELLKPGLNIKPISPINLSGF